MPRTSLPTLLFLLRYVLASPFSSLMTMVAEPVERPPATPGSAEFWEKVVISIALVLAGGVFAGLGWYFMVSLAHIDTLLASH